MACWRNEKLDLCVNRSWQCRALTQSSTRGGVRYRLKDTFKLVVLCRRQTNTRIDWSAQQLRRRVPAALCAQAPGHAELLKYHNKLAFQECCYSA